MPNLGHQDGKIHKNQKKHQILPCSLEMKKIAEKIEEKCQN
jgi:hypothetical protein